MEDPNFIFNSQIMEQKENHDETVQAKFDREIKALIRVLAEICVHELLNQTQKEKSHDKK